MSVLSAEERKLKTKEVKHMEKIEEKTKQYTISLTSEEVLFLQSIDIKNMSVAISKIIDEYKNFSKTHAKAGGKL